ncbi:hypothetical protein [Pseudoalteromonas sp. B530]|uniref:hypothetical protein n=1 Tax=Pseudoalteromonas sp. B530 TaxID=2994390 RepID=UPI00224B86A5|nr:hypothetical protein [Pseudoalteromonas sp. B530]MCF7512916.1 hypothetical protein [Pseudoalteromonas sp. L7]MCX2765412.1 hypothetical protein [Pseudoalteromonas sp. B530]
MSSKQREYVNATLAPLRAVLAIYVLLALLALHVLHARLVQTASLVLSISVTAAFTVSQQLRQNLHHCNVYSVNLQGALALNAHKAYSVFLASFRSV